MDFSSRQSYTTSYYNFLLVNYFMKNPAIFKSYDVRGIYPDDIDEKAVYATGRALVQYLQAQVVAVGRDIRTSSPPLFESLVKGITEAGADVIDLGIVSTPVLNYSTTVLDVDAGLMLTASHNPAQYNGLKFCKRNAVPMGLETGLSDIRDQAIAGNFNKTDKPGTITQNNALTKQFHDKTAQFVTFDNTPFTIAFDFANAMGIAELPFFERFPNLTIHSIYDEYDGSFPNHEANPLKPETLIDLGTLVREQDAAMGIAYDGDGDRIGFTDETGAPVPGDLILAIIAQELFKLQGAGDVIADPRCTRALKEIVEEKNGTYRLCKVGHSHIKKMMRENNSLVGGEVSMHYYFRDFGFADNSNLVAVLILNLMAETGNKLSEIVAEVRRYHHSGEINFEVKDSATLIQTLKEEYADGELSEIDGIRIDYPDWWFSVRSSNTEPVVRLNLEATNDKLLEARKAELTQHIQEA